MSNSVVISDKLMKKLQIKSNKTGIKVSELVENILSESLNKEDISNYVNFTESETDNSLKNIIGIAKADYTDDAVQIKKDSRRY